RFIEAGALDAVPCALDCAAAKPEENARTVRVAAAITRPAPIKQPREQTLSDVIAFISFSSFLARFKAEASSTHYAASAYPRHHHREIHRRRHRETLRRQSWIVPGRKSPGLRCRQTRGRRDRPAHKARSLGSFRESRRCGHRTRGCETHTDRLRNGRIRGANRAPSHPSPSRIRRRGQYRNRFRKRYTAHQHPTRDKSPAKVQPGTRRPTRDRTPERRRRRDPPAQCQCRNRGLLLSAAA